MIRKPYVVKYPFSYRCVRRARYPGLPVELKVIFEVLNFPEDK